MGKRKGNEKIATLFIDLQKGKAHKSRFQLSIFLTVFDHLFSRFQNLLLTFLLYSLFILYF